MNDTNNTLVAVIIVIAVLAFGVGMFSPFHISSWGSGMGGPMMIDTMGEHRSEFLAHRDGMVEEMLEHGMYSCCLEKPCTYCIEKTPGHGEGAACNCLEDVVEGRHPCGECIGEILEGHGNPYLTQYFASAIAEEVGEQHINTLREIISEKYGTPISEQL